MTEPGPPIAPPRLHRAALGRADLVRVLATAEPGLTQVAELMGYQPRAEPRPARIVELAGKGDVSVKAVEIESPEHEIRPPLQATHYHVHQTPAPEVHADEREAVPPLTAIPVADPAVHPPVARPLASPSRLSSTVRRYLRRPGPSRLLDVERWVRLVATGSLPARLPTRQLRQWGESAALVVNGYGSHVPVHQDLRQLVDVVRSTSGGATPVYWLNPEGRWLRARPGRGAPRWADSSAPPAQCRHWLWAGPDAAAPASLDWSELIRARLRSKGSVACLRAGAGMPTLPASARLLRWDVGSDLRESRLHRDAPLEADDRLLAALSLAVRVEPALLREIRLLLALPVEAEIAVWTHAEVVTSPHACCLRPDRIEHWRDAARVSLNAEQGLRIARCIARHHRHVSPLIQSEEAAIATALAPEAVDPVAQARWRAVAATLRLSADSEIADALARYLRRFGGRADAALYAKNPDVAEAWLLAERESLVAGEMELPAGIDPAMAASVLEGISPPPSDGDSWSLIQRGPDLWIVSGLRRHALSTLPKSARGVLVEQGEQRRWLRLEGDVRVGDARHLPLTLRHPAAVLEVAHVPRPLGTFEFGRNARGVYARSARLGDQQATFRPMPPQEADPSCVFAPKGAARFGNASSVPFAGIAIRADFGVYAQLIIHGATQRFRWIPPGEFWMGSSDAERARIKDNDAKNWAKREAPRHRVQLTQGYWLADTPCTQAFWEALMSDNPSEFKGDPQRPVENVSWEDAQRALAKLNPLLPAGSHADLPTEAEWEYACRAGTDTAFSCGDTLRADQARFWGTDPFGRGSGETGTTPVASYPANPWGLFDMHGNVWEWCRDGLRVYSEPAVVDPEGPLRAARAVRGGSWFDYARYCRSAYRNASGPGIRDDGLGFRLLLRSTSPVALPEAAPEHAPEARGEARRDAGPTLAERAARAVTPKGGKPK